MSNTVEHNLKRWSDHSWESKGEHWSTGWGGSNAQWRFTVHPRVARHLPAGDVVEIATGFGRWSKFLFDHCETYHGFDLVDKCTEYCRQTYSAPNRQFTTNDGLHLTGIPDHSVDFVFSMDSLVHVDWPTLRSYLNEIVRVLRPNGTAMIHHSNAGALPDFESLGNRRAYRAPDVSAYMVRKEVTDIGAGIIGQEIIDWGGSGSDNLIDCFSTISAQPIAEPKIVENPFFMKDMRIIASIAPIYS